MDANQIQPYIDILNQNNLTALKIKDGDCFYMNFMEYENWSANGNYF